jgi:hypothetical protein
MNILDVRLRLQLRRDKSLVSVTPDWLISAYDRYLGQFSATGTELVHN